MINYPKLIEKAIIARKNAYIPYSNFAVGAALLCADGNIFIGANVENVSYTPTCCAERSAFFSAISNGANDFVAIAVVGDLKEYELPRNYCPPCGVCRQVMLELCDYNKFEIIIAKNTVDYKVYTLNKIMPYKFEIKE